MDKITPMNIDIVRTDIMVILEEVQKKHGITIHLGNTSYDDLQFTSKLTVTIGDGSAKAKKDFIENCKWIDVPADWYGKEFQNNGTTSVIVGLNLKAPKYPIKYMEKVSGRGFKCTVKGMRMMLLQSQEPVK